MTIQLEPIRYIEADAQFASYLCMDNVHAIRFAQDEVNGSDQPNTYTMVPEKENMFAKGNGHFQQAMIQQTNTCTHLPPYTLSSLFLSATVSQSAFDDDST